MENLDTRTPKERNINDTSTAEMCNTGTSKRLNRKQRRDMKFRRGLWKQRNRRLNRYKKK